MTKSAPFPPVISRSRSWAFSRVELIMCVAPHFSAACSLKSFLPITTTCFAPLTLASAAAPSAMEPVPITATVVSGRISYFFTAPRAMDSGSASAASSRLTESARG